MEAITAATWIGAGVLLVAGWSKLTRPDATSHALSLADLPDDRIVVRTLGVAELGVGTLVLTVGGAFFTAMQAVMYAAFAVFTARQLSRPAASCGCFGQHDAPLSRLHVAVDVALAAASAAAAVTATPGIVPIGIGPATLLAALLVVSGVAAVRTLLVDVPVLAAAMRRPIRG